ncbi:MAG TPA: hypothetical protein VMT38_05615 [Terracidiphilus sp.]|nr:hypothetical protein [Terracidiphilus sp.]
MNDPGIPSQAAPTSPISPLPPLTFGQALDRILKLVRANFRLFTGIAMVPAAFAVAFEATMLGVMFSIIKPWENVPARASFNPVHISFFVVACVIGSVLLLVVYALYEPAGIYAALKANVGVKITFGEAWAVALRKAGRYVWLAILRALIVMVPILIVAGVLAGTLGLSLAHGGAQNGQNAIFVILPLFMLLYLCALVYGVLIMLRLVLAVPACLTEDVPAWAAIRRSNYLSRGAKGRIFLLLLLIYAIAYIAFMVFEVVVGLVAAFGLLIGVLLHLTLVPWGIAGAVVGGLIFFCGFMVWAAASYGAYLTIFAVIYQDQRRALEGKWPELAG